MKKRLKITIEVDTEDPSAKGWETMEDYIATEMDEALYYVYRHGKRNYSVMRKGTSIKVSMRTIKPKIK